MLLLSQARNCTNRTCIEFRIQHRNATLKKLELERDLTAMRLKYDMLFDQITTQGVAATARAAAIGEEAIDAPATLRGRTRVPLHQTDRSAQRF